MENNTIYKPRPIESNISDKILSATLVGFMIPAVLTSPLGLYVIVSGATKYYFRKNDFHREIKRLQKRKFIALAKCDKGWTLKLLQKGKLRMKAIDFDNLKLQKSKLWDGKWRLYTFDIPEQERSVRDSIRRKLKRLGMYNIQRSVFAYPFDCRKELGIVSEHYKVSKFATYLETSFIDIDKELRQHFKFLL